MSISYLNSLTPRNVVSGFVFAGVYDEILSTSQITTRVTNTFVNNSYTLLVQYSNDKVNEVNNEIYYSTNNYNNLIYFTPTSRYFKLTFTLVSGDLDNLSIETIFKSAIVYKPFVAITGTVSVDNLPAISGNVSVTNWPETSNVNITTCVPLTISSLPAISIGNSGFTSNIIASVPLTIETLPSITILNSGFTSNIIASVPLTIQTLPEITIANTGFTSNITTCIPLTISSLPAITGNVAISGAISLLPAADPNSTIGTVRLNDAYGNPLVTTAGNLMIGINNIYTTNALHTILDSVNSNVTIQCQERPTTESYFSTSVGTGGLAITLSPKTLRNFSFNTTSAVIVYVMLYDTGLAPVITDTPIFVFPIMNANNVIFNSFDHRFVNGLGLRAVTTYAGGGTGNPVANTVFINMTLSD